MGDPAGPWAHLQELSEKGGAVDTDSPDVKGELAAHLVPMQKNFEPQTMTAVNGDSRLTMSAMNTGRVAASLDW